MKRNTLFSAVTVVAALSLAGQALAFGGMGGGGGRGGGPAGFSHERSSFNSQSRSIFTDDNPGKHLGLGKNGKSSGRDGAGRSNGGLSQGSNKGIGGSNSGQGRSGSSIGSGGTTGGAGKQQGQGSNTSRN